MPPFYYRWRRRPPWRQRRRLRYRRRRLRRPFRTTFYRRRRVRKKTYKRHYKKKLKRILVKQWQPKKIRNCTIKGMLCLFACGQQRIGDNFTLYSESIVPEREPGGGGWAITQLTLNALWDEYTKYRCWWTTSNDGLPLVRYIRCTLTFYKSKWTDYIVIPQLCPPFDVGRDDYLNTQPSRALMNKNKIIVPRLRPNERKPYIKRHFYPPSLWQTKWYFQQDVCKLPFIVLRVSACDFQQFWQPENMLSYNITLTSLSTFFTNPWFESKGTTGYSPKTTNTPTPGTKLYLYGSENGLPSTMTNIKWQDLVFLGECNRWTKGKKITSNYQVNDWGNPFHQAYTGEHGHIFYSHIDVNTARSKSTEAAQITKLEYMFQNCRYNPLKDDGKGNKVYFKSTSLEQGTMDVLPSKGDIIIEGYPLWIVFWGWVDWLKKLKPINHIETEYLCVVQSNYIYPKQAWYVFLDYYFYGQEHFDNDLTETEKANWHPRYDFQTESVYHITETGPGSPKINRSKCIQASMLYNFKVKWGGCPAPMETFTDPCQQEKFPIPNYFNQTNEIIDPETAKEHFLQMWDEKRQTITTRAAKRIKTIQSPTKSLTEYGAKDVPTKTQETESDQTETSEEEETPLQINLQQLKRHNKRLKQRLRKLQLTQK
nr:MAG: ORF1 [TTV-like mini virus]